MSDIEQHDNLQKIREQYEKVEFGIEVHNFLHSKIGKFLIKHAEDEREKAIDDLKDVDAFDSNAIRKLQDVIRRAESIQRWMANAIQDGLDAEEFLRDQDE